MKKTQRNISFTQPRSASLFCRFLPESLAKMGRKLASYPTSARLKPIQGGNQCNKTTQKPVEMGNPTWMLIHWYFFHVCPFQDFFFAWRTLLASLSLNPQANFDRQSSSLKPIWEPPTAYHPHQKWPLWPGEWKFMHLSTVLGGHAKTLRMEIGLIVSTLPIGEDQRLGANTTFKEHKPFFWTASFSD